MGKRYYYVGDRNLAEVLGVDPGYYGFELLPDDAVARLSVPKYVEPPFAVGDVIEAVEPCRYERTYEVVRDMNAYMELKCLNGNLVGFTFRRGKDNLRRNYRLVV